MQNVAAPPLHALASAQDAPGIAWTFGPLNSDLGGVARLHLPRGMIWIGRNEARRFLEFTGNPLSGGELGVAGAANLDWFAVISWRSFESLGFETRRPKPEEIAEAVRSGTAAANNERTRRGRETLEVLEWGAKPVFDERRGRLEFMLRTQESGGRRVENRFVYLLGRRGVLEVELVTETGAGASAFSRLLNGISWRDGEAYTSPAAWAPLWVTGAAAAVAAALLLRLRRQRGQ